MIVQSDLRSFCTNCSKGKLVLKQEQPGSSWYFVAHVACEYMQYCGGAVANYQKACEEEEKTEKIL